MSAAHFADFPDLVGKWVVGTNFAPASTSAEVGFNVSVILNYQDNDGSVKQVSWQSAGFYVISDGSGNISGITFYPSYSDRSNAWISFNNSKIFYKNVDGDGSTYNVDSDSTDDILRIVEFTSPTITMWGGGADPYLCYERITTYLQPYVEPEPPKSLLGNILDTFSEVGSWIGTIISSLVALFWSVDTASLTFLGILSVAGLAFSVIMLLFGIVTRFVGFSG